MRSEPQHARTLVWALPVSLAATSRITCCFLFLRLLRCFSSPGSPPYVMDWRMDTWGLLKWVSPFRYLRIIGYLLLPEAFRSLSRLSSALSAKASTIRSFQHDQLVLIHGNGWSLHRYSVTGVGSRFVFLLRFLEGVVIINNIPVNNNYLGCLE